MLVSVCMITHGHEKFIRQAIESILMQKCDFDVELIIANDFSPDDTDNVIRDIIKNNSKASIVHYISHKSNIGMAANFLFALQQCKGKYIAFCEGDDYWIDKLKLQKQKDYFSAYPQVSLVHTDYTVYLQNTGAFIPSSHKKRMIDSSKTYDDLIANNFIAMLTVMADRNVILDAVQKIGKMIQTWTMADYPIWLYVASKYKVGYMPQQSAVYRYLPASASHTSSLKKNLKFLNNIVRVRQYAHKHFKKTSPKNMLGIYSRYYYESSIYIYRKIKQKLYDRKNIE